MHCIFTCITFEYQIYRNMKEKELTEKAQSLLKSIGLVWLETELSGTMDKIKLLVKETEKQKLEFAMSMLNRAKDLDLKTVYLELEQKISEL